MQCLQMDGTYEIYVILSSVIYYSLRTGRDYSFGAKSTNNLILYPHVQLYGNLLLLLF